MQLTLHTDYSLRVLIYLQCTGSETTIAEIADRFQISRNHLVKVVHELGKKGYVHTTRGRGGGISLACAPEKVTIGQVVRDMEANFNIVECFHVETSNCVLTPHCALKGALMSANRAFLKELDKHTLASVTQNHRTIQRLLSAV